MDEFIDRLGMVGELDDRIGPIKQRNRGLTAGQLLMGMATAQLAGQDCLAGMDRVRADAGSALLVAAPVAPSRTAGVLAERIGARCSDGIEAALHSIYTRWLGRVPAQVRSPLVLRHLTIDLDATDIEVFGKQKEGIGWNYSAMSSQSGSNRA
ncbi:MAG: hypothetical protein ACYCU5_12740 [Actinomycetes bacterium]